MTKKPSIPMPDGGIKTNEQEARWLSDTLTMRFEEMISANIGMNIQINMTGLYELLLLSLNKASRRGCP